MLIIKKVRRSLKKRGLWNSITFVAKRLLLKFRFREFDFGGLIEPSEMNVPDESRIHANKYEASNIDCFKNLLAGLDWQYNKSTFIDFGCGKGASLVFAFNLGFKKVIGVEYSPELAHIAFINLQKFSHQKGGNANFQIENIDASKYEIPSNADCFYFFNPFDAFILDQVLLNIVKTLEKYPRKILIAYLNAVHHTVVEKYNFKKIKYISHKELDINYNCGAYVYTNE